MGQKEPKNSQAKGRLLQFRQNKQADVQCLYSDCDGELLKSAVDSVTRKGAAIMFGVTSDGGAFSVLILDGNDKAREYPHGADELNDVLRAAIASFSD